MHMYFDVDKLTLCSDATSTHVRDTKVTPDLFAYTRGAPEEGLWMILFVKTLPEPPR